MEPVPIFHGFDLLHKGGAAVVTLLLTAGGGIA
jgi:hypothetical protein